MTKCKFEFCCWRCRVLLGTEASLQLNTWVSQVWRKISTPFHFLIQHSHILQIKINILSKYPMYRAMSTLSSISTMVTHMGPEATRQIDSLTQNLFRLHKKSHNATVWCGEGIKHDSKCIWVNRTRGHLTTHRKWSKKAQFWRKNIFGKSPDHPQNQHKHKYI